MTRATREDKYTGEARQYLHVAFELGVSEWKLEFSTQLGGRARLRIMPARDLRREIAEAKSWCGLKSWVPVRSCYEAGRDGFWCTGT